jgi:HK97 family phage major capsid protein
MDLEEYLDTLTGEIRQLREAGYESKSSARRGSRFVGPGADESVVSRVASGGTVTPSAKNYDYAPSDWERTHGRGGTGNRPIGLARHLKALAEGTGPSGGFLVPQEISDEILTQVRARVAVTQMRVTTIGVRKELLLNSASTGATAAYVAENAVIPVSEQTFSQATFLRPKTLAALVPVSNRLLRDAVENPDLEQFLIRDISEVIALRADLAFLQGSGTGNEPLGIKNMTGLTPAPNLGGSGAAPTWDNLKDMVANIRATNAPFANPGWIFHPRALNTLEKLKDSTGHYLADAGLLTFDRTGASGTLLGYRFVTSGQIPINLTAGSNNDASYIVFGSDWDECILGEETEGVVMDTSAEASYTTDAGATWNSAYQQMQTLFRAFLAHDIGLRRPAFFSVMTGVRP